MFLVPPSHVFVTWATCLVPGGLTVLVGTVSYIVLDRTFLRRPAGGIGSRADLWRLLGAECVFLASLCIYPPTAMVIMVFTMAHIAFSPLADWPSVRRRVVRDLLFAAGGMALYFGLVKAYLHFMRHFSEASRARLAVLNKGVYKFALTTDVAAFFRKLLQIAVAAMSGIWHTLYGERAGWVVLALVLGGGLCLVVAAFRVRRARRQGKPPPRAAVALAGPVHRLGSDRLRRLDRAPAGRRKGRGAGGLPHVVRRHGGRRRTGRGRPPPSRLCRACLAMALVAVLMTASVVLSARHVSLIVGNCCLEYDYLRQQLLSADLDGIRNIAVVHIGRGDSLVRRGLLKNEAGLLVVDAFGLSPVVREAIHDRGLDPDRYRIFCLEPAEMSTVPGDDSTLLIDLRDAKLDHRACGAERARRRPSPRAPLTPQG